MKIKKKRSKIRASRQVRYGADMTNLSCSSDKYGPYGYKDIVRMYTGKAPDWFSNVSEIEMDFGDGKKLADRLIRIGKEVRYNEDQEMWYIPKDAHWYDCDFYNYPTADENDHDAVYSSTQIDSSVIGEKSWFELSWNEQLEQMISFVQEYTGTRVFEDFAESVGVDTQEIIDSFCDAEAHGDIQIPKEMQIDSDYANDDIYSSTQIDSSMSIEYTDEPQEGCPSCNRLPYENGFCSHCGYYESELFDSLLKKYKKEFSPETRMDVWEKVFEEYLNTGLADDVILELEMGVHPAIRDEIYNSTNISCADEAETVDEYEDEIQEIGQEFTSENTSINSGKLPAVFNMVHFEPGTVNIDYGGGRFDNVAEYLSQYDVINLVYDPYNRSKEHNQEVIRLVREHGGADTATCSNVLNVIKEREVRINVLQNIKKLVKPEGEVYITVYEGSGKGNEGPTKSGYQLNRKTKDYIEEIQEVFPDATRKGKLIICHPNGAGIDSSTEVTGSSEMYDGLKEEIETAVADTMTGPRFGFERDEAYQYFKVIVSEQVSEYDNSEYIKVEVRAELSYDGMMELSTVLDKIIAKYDENAYFDMECPGIMNAFIEKSNYVSSSTDIQGGPELPLDPPDVEPLPTREDEQESYELELNAVIVVNEEGDWDYEDDSCPWANVSETEEDLYSYNYPNVLLSDHSTTVETVSDMIDSMLPAAQGRYHITGDVELVFTISDVEYKRDYFDDGEGGSYDEDIFTDDVDVAVDDNKSIVKNFNFKELEEGEMIQSSTSIFAAQIHYSSSKPVTTAEGYTQRSTVEVGTDHHKYAIYETDLPTEEKAGEYRFNIYRLSAYDDANYYSCLFKGGMLKFIQSGKVIKEWSMIYDDEQYEDVRQWIDYVIEYALNNLYKMNTEISSVMIHN